MKIKILIYILEILYNFYQYKKLLITYLSKIKISRYPLFIVYSPIDYLVNGNQILQILQILKPGDIIGRGFRNYLYGKFKRSDYISCGIYIGNNKVIYSSIKGVCQINIIDFLKCDNFCILRPNKYIRKSLRRLKKLLGYEFDFDFEQGNNKLYNEQLIVKCYEQFNYQRYYPVLFGKQIKLLGKVFTFDSFLTCQNFKKIYEYNPQKQDELEKGIQNILKVYKKVKRK